MSGFLKVAVLVVISVLLTSTSYSRASEKFLFGYKTYNPKWENFDSVFKKYYSERFDKEFQNNWDTRISEITSIVAADTKGGVADFALYYEYMTAALQLFSNNNKHAAFAYKAKALSHLEAAVATRLPEAQIVKFTLMLDGLFYEHDHETAVNAMLTAANSDAGVRDAFITDFQFYFPSKKRKEIFEKFKNNPLPVVGKNRYINFYSSENMTRYGYHPFYLVGTSLDLPSKKPDYIDTVSAYCMMFFLQEAEGKSTDAYRKMQRCSRSLDFKFQRYFLAELKDGIRAGQTHYLAELGIYLLFDEDHTNDDEGLEYLKLSVLNDMGGEYELAQHYNFGSREIEKCIKVVERKKIFPLAEPEISIIANDYAKNFKNIWIHLPFGCFEGLARINGKKVLVQKNITSYDYSFNLKIPKATLRDRDECFEFVNARINFHPDWGGLRRLNSLKGSKHIAYCDD